MVGCARAPFPRGICSAQIAYGPLIVVFLIPARKVVNDFGKALQVTRAHYLRERGYTVINLANSDIRDNFATCLNRINETLAQGVTSQGTSA